MQVNTNPLQNIVAQPTEDDLFVWHGNGESAPQRDMKASTVN